ncbi:hypothetical protein GCM10009679_18910 [Saccharothrix algeriensis]|uniref:Nudix hydrolase domain-containing protein n=1 Tax=Catellatospora bangladeshensis TaxID=310355 RepID=A0A8J3JMC7_9ACTN|nr:hypothetical protein Cba03nite_29490 [Catellatospora bangladeshensis]
MRAAVQVAVILLVNRAGDLLLQQRSSSSARFPGAWGVPGGHCEPGEAPEQTAVRELWEEAGLRPDGAVVLFERHVDAWTDGLIEHCFAAGTVAVQDDVIRDDGGAMIFVPAPEAVAGREFTPGTAEVLKRFLRSPEYARLAGGVPEPYDGDREDDERFAGWDYLGDRYVCPLADEHRTCHRRANLLLAQERADALRAMANDGHRCAFVRLMQWYVDGDRVDELHAIAAAGDDRATVTLYQYLQHRHRAADLETALGRYTESVPRLRIWLAAHIGGDPGRADEALELLSPLLDHDWYAQEARQVAYRIQVGAGRVPPPAGRKR